MNYLKAVGAVLLAFGGGSLSGVAASDALGFHCIDGLS